MAVLALDPCVGPIAFVCQLTDGVQGAASDYVLGGLGDAFVAGAAQVGELALTALDAGTAIDLGAGWFRANVAVTQPVEKVVVIDNNLEPAQAAKTLAHELGHICANHYGRFPDYAIDRVCRGAAEVEAESIAYIVTSHLGMNPAAYSVPYVAGWADDLDVLRHHMSTVVTASQWILGDLEKTSAVDTPAATRPLARPQMNTAPTLTL